MRGPEQSWRTPLSAVMENWLVGVEPDEIAEHHDNMTCGSWLQTGPSDQAELIRRLEATDWTVTQSKTMVADVDRR